MFKPVTVAVVTSIIALTISSLQAQAVSQAAPAPAAKHDEGATILFLGDSLSLCGFGKRLDEQLRQMPGVKAVFTYMACATQPLSWLKERPYTNMNTHCGFWSIESVPGSAQPRQLEDVYGQRRGSTPKSHPVPKLEDLLGQIRPDILIMQTGGNLFDLFPGHRSVRPDRDGPALKRYVLPFVVKAIHPPSSCKKVYWVSPPTSGRVSPEVQDFVVQQVRTQLGPVATVIDSRPLISYPYRHMEPDHEHFLGPDMDLWADKVFGIISQDLATQSVASLKPLSELFPQLPAATQTAASAPTPAAPRTNANGEIFLSARLVLKSKPMGVEEFLPYQESMVGFVYDVRRVLAGGYDEKQVLVMHPAYIGLKKQSLRKYRTGRSYRLRLRPLEGTPWDTVKRRDESGRIDLQPYIQLQDEARYPGANHAN